jgi:hypothetical protein
MSIHNSIKGGKFYYYSLRYRISMYWNITYLHLHISYILYSHVFHIHTCKRGHWRHYHWLTSDSDKRMLTIHAPPTESSHIMYIKTHIHYYINIYTHIYIYIHLLCSIHMDTCIHTNLMNIRFFCIGGYGYDSTDMAAIEYRLKTLERYVYIRICDVCIYACIFVWICIHISLYIYIDISM